MFTHLSNGKRICIQQNQVFPSWEYIKGVLVESGFVLVQEASVSEFVMKGCHNKILVYVKYIDPSESTLVFINDNGKSTQTSIEWGGCWNFHKGGEEILTCIRELWKTTVS